MKRMMGLFGRAIKKWGRSNQLGMFQEECAEAIVAVNKYFRKPGEDTLKALADEVADVEIMCEQMRWIVGNDEVNKVKQFKLQRLEKMLKGK